MSRLSHILFFLLTSFAESLCQTPKILYITLEQQPKDCCTELKKRIDVRFANNPNYFKKTEIESWASASNSVKTLFKAGTVYRVNGLLEKTKGRYKLTLTFYDENEKPWPSPIEKDVGKDYEILQWVTTLIEEDYKKFTPKTAIQIKTLHYIQNCDPVVKLQLDAAFNNRIDVDLNGHANLKTIFRFSSECNLENSLECHANISSSSDIKILSYLKYGDGKQLDPVVPLPTPINSVTFKAFKTLLMDSLWKQYSKR